MIRTAQFTPDGCHRISLWRSWAADEEGAGTVLALGLNPSKADADRDDATIRRLVGFAKREGFTSLCVVNLFTRVATDPAELRALPLAERNHTTSLREFAALLARAQEAWPIFGALAADEIEHARTYVTLLLGHRVPMRCFGTTRRGWPRHPVRLANATVLEPWKWPGAQPFRRLTAFRDAGFRARSRLGANWRPGAPPKVRQ